MDIGKLERLLEQEENPKLDFKEYFQLKTDSQKKEFAKDVIAMANTKGGRGYIVFGIKDKTKEIVGIDLSDLQEESMQQIVNSRTYPPVPISVDTLEYKDKVLAVLTIFRSELKPHQMIQNGAFYVRRGSTTDVARREEIAAMMQEYGLMSHERVVIHQAPLESLNFERIEKYFNPDLMLLEALGMIGYYSDGWHPTIGGLMLFGYEPQLYLPYTYIQVNLYGEIMTIEGSINTMIDQLDLLFKKHCPSQHYPIEGLQEAVANAIIHRDYFDQTRFITIEINNKNIVVTNPGALVYGNKLYRDRVELNSIRRNPWLYQRCMLIDEHKRFYKHDVGMDYITKAFKKHKVKFVNLNSSNLFRAILPSWDNYE